MIRVLKSDLTESGEYPDVRTLLPVLVSRFGPPDWSVRADVETTRIRLNNVRRDLKRDDLHMLSELGRRTGRTVRIIQGGFSAQTGLDNPNQVIEFELVGEG